MHSDKRVTEYIIPISDGMTKEITKEDWKERLTLSMDTLTSRIKDVEFVEDATFDKKTDEVKYLVESLHDSEIVHGQVRHVVESYFIQSISKK